jgi:hypothetical protein
MTDPYARPGEPSPWARPGAPAEPIVRPGEQPQYPSEPQYQPSQNQPGPQYPAYAPPPYPGAYPGVEPYPTAQPYQAASQYPTAQPYEAAPQYPPAQPYQPVPQYPAAQPYQPVPPPQPYAQMAPFVPNQPFTPRRPPVDPNSVDRASIIGAICGALALIPAAVPLGIVGLVRTSGHKRRGRIPAILALVFSGAWLAGLIVLAIVAGGSPPDRDASGRLTSVQNIPFGALRTGDCFILPEDDQSTVKLKAGPCSAAHNSEVIDVVTTGAVAYSGVSSSASANCSESTAAYLGARGADAPENIQLYYFVPSESQWKSGNHKAACVLTDEDGNFTGDMLTHIFPSATSGATPSGATPSGTAPKSPGSTTSKSPGSTTSKPASPSSPTATATHS